MEEMAELKKLLNPQEILFVADAMTGQDAVNSAKEFTSSWRSPASSSPRWMATPAAARRSPSATSPASRSSSSARARKPDAFEPFHPDRIVSRIMGMGDMMTLIERAEETLDKKKQRSSPEGPLRRRLLAGRLPRPAAPDPQAGLHAEHLKMLPSVGPFRASSRWPGRWMKAVHRIEAIINSMTKQERDNHEIISGSRRKRIARGSGTSVQEVNQLLRQYAQMRKMFKSAARAAACSAG
jgi:signal recognition particle subunit SRP54